MKSMTCSFPGGEKVDVHFHTYTVHTDQRKSQGGEGAAPNPFEYLFVSIASCAASSALGYCQENDLPTETLQVSMHAEKHPAEPRYDTITLSVTPPPGCSAEHLEGLRAAVDACTVKRHFQYPPTFQTVFADHPSDDE